MKLLYEDELMPCMSMPKEQLLSYAKNLVDSHNADNFQKANELSYMLRRKRRHEESAQIAKMMYEDMPTADRLNLYFVAVVDQGDVTKIRELSNLADEYVFKNGYQKHLFATWLKAANKILDNELFDRVYGMVPEDEKFNNTYIISQFYVYMNRCSQYVEVCNHYQQLPRHLQQATFVKRYYENARARMGYLTENPFVAEKNLLESIDAQKPQNIVENMSCTLSQFANVVSSTTNNPGKSYTTGSTQERQIFLVYGGMPANLPVIEALLNASGIRYINLSNEVKTGNTIIEAFEKQASLTDFAIVLCTPDNEGADGSWYPRLNVIFEYGYFMAKLGRRNVCLLRYENGKKLVLPSDFNSIYQISMDKGTWANELGNALRSAGYNVTF